MNKPTKQEQNNLTNSHWKGMTSSIQPISSSSSTRQPDYRHPDHRHPDACLVYNRTDYLSRADYSSSRPEFNSRSRSDSYEVRGELEADRNGDAAHCAAPSRSNSGSKNGDAAHCAAPSRSNSGSKNGDTAPPSRTTSDNRKPNENGTMSLGRIKGKKEADFLRSATIGRHDVTSRYHGDVSRYHADGHYNGREGDPRQRETAFPPRDTLSDKLRSARDPRDEFHEPRDYVETRDYHEPREGSKKVSRQQQSRDSKDSRRYVDHEENKSARNRQQQKMNGKIPEDLYKATQQRTSNDHIFVQYGKEVRRILVSRLPIPLETLLQKMVGVFSDSLTPDMVPLRAIYIQDAQTKIFYQLDDPADLTKGSHVKINEESLIKTVDRGSSQSLEDLNNTSNSSLSSGGFVIPANLNLLPPGRPGKSRLSLVEERLSFITHEMHHIKSDTGSTVSSQTGVVGEITAYPAKSDLPAQMSKLRHEHLHTIIRSLHKNLQDSRSELLLLKRREQQTRAEMDHVINVTREEITRHIEASLPQGLRKQRMEADKVEARYRAESLVTYSNLKDLERTVDVLKTDVVKRKVKLDPIQLASMETELKSYTQQVSSMNSTFVPLKDSLKEVMAEELEIIVNEEQFLEDEEPMLEEASIKCDDLARVIEALKKVAVMQKERGTNPLSIYTASEHDIMEERHNVIQDIASIQPNHDERILSIQATEEFRATQKKFVKSESDCVAEEIQQKSQNLRKTHAFAELEKKRDEALKAMYTAQPPPHKFGRRDTRSKFGYSNLNKCKSMSSIVNAGDDSRAFRFIQSDEIEDVLPTENRGEAKVKRSRSFSKDKEKLSSEDEKVKKKTGFSVANLFSKKSRSKFLEDFKNKETTNNDNVMDTSAGSNGDVFVVDSAKRNGGSPPSPHFIPRSYTDGFRKVTSKSKHKPDRSISLNLDDKVVRKGKSR